MQFFDNIQNELISRIIDSEKTLKVAVTWLTNHDIFDAILTKLNNPSYKVTLIVLNDRINNKREGVNFQKLIDCKGSFYFSSVENMVHHKFCIIDDETVITGSYNWTYYAENRNWENIVILKDKEIVNGYIQEFEKVIQNHKQVEKVIEEQKLEIGINSNEYLETDYIFQAKNEQKKGNDLATAKIYNEILRINNKQAEIQKARTEIVNKINNQKFEVCPFEIGIQFTSGYSMAIPAFTPLPITIKRGGNTPIDNATSLQITIQKYDFVIKTILQFSLDKLKPCPKGTEKIEHILTVDQSGILTVICNEVNGYNRTITKRIDLKNFV
jgi:hypothetical protein